MTTVYVPGTEETDLKKIIMSLQQIGPRLGTAEDTLTAMRAAWTAYTPTLSAGSGSFTSATASGRYLSIGKTTFISIRIDITTNGTAAVSIGATLPNTSGSALQSLAGTTFNGFSINTLIGGGATATAIFKYDGTYPGGSGVTIVVSGAYENA